MTVDADIPALIKRVLGIDITDPAVRERAWQRLHVFREIADECERDGNQPVADMLRRTCVPVPVDSLN